MPFTAIKQAALAVVVMQALALTPAHAAETASEDALAAAQLVGEYCPGQWESPGCLKAVSQSNLVMVSNYGGNLQERGKQQAAEQIKEHCAASTAGTEGDYPAYAMKSAFVECANTISTISEQTRITPDLSHYQLLVGATICLDKAPACRGIEQTLRQHAGR